MDEIKYELTNLDSTQRAMRTNGTHEKSSGYEEVWLGNHSGLDVWAGVDVGGYSADTTKYLSEHYTDRQAKTYSSYLSVYTLERIISGVEKAQEHHQTWAFADVHLHFYVMNTQVAEPYLFATKQEIGFCPEANIVALDEPQAFGVLDVVKNAIRGNVSLFDYALNKALVEAKSLASDISRKLAEK
jgi:hypothetical protein